MRKEIRGFVLFALLAALVGAGILYGAQKRRAEALEQELEGYRMRDLQAAESAAHTLSGALTDMNGALQKLSAAASKEQTARLLTEIRRLSDRAGDALDGLSISHVDGSALRQFLTRSGDYADTLFQSVQGGVLLTESDTAQLSAIGTQCEALLSALSESSENAEPRGLPQTTVSEAQAKAIAADFTDIDWQFAGRCAGEMATFDFSGPLGESLSITERGGKILYWMTQPSGKNAAPPDDAERERIAALAEEYLRRADFGAMWPSYAQFYAGCAVLNFAAVQNGVVLYPDLIKVYVDRETEQVIGFDARSYWSHHTVRELPEPALSVQDAKNAVTLSMRLESVALCLIPKSDVREVLCYECKGTVGERTFLVYINAETGAEEEIFALTRTEEGDFVA